MPGITRDNFVGKKFHRLTVLERVKRDDGTTGWLCLCECGNKKVYPSSVVRHELNQSCGCYRHEAPKHNFYPKKGKTEDLSGRKFGKLTCVAVSHQGPDRRYYWKCKCDCGKETVSAANTLKSGAASSCGCSRIGRKGHTKMRGIPKTHGHATRCENGNKQTSKEYRAWCEMKRRCLNQNHHAYAQYGGRGIKIHPTWVNDFMQFYKDVGPAPSEDHSIDRLNDGNYEPGCVRWATDTEQVRNRRTTKMVEAYGKRMPLAEACEKLDMDYEWTRVLHSRGLSFEEIINKKAAHTGRLDLKERYLT